MESNETPPSVAQIFQKSIEKGICERSLSAATLPVSTTTTPLKVLDKSDAISSSTAAATKLQSFKIVATPLTNTTQKVIVSPVNLLADQPTVTVKLGSNQLNVKMVSNASLIQNSSVVTSQSSSPIVNGLAESKPETTSTKSVTPQSVQVAQCHSDGSSDSQHSVVSRDESPVKLTREQKQLNKSINSSLMLSQMVMGVATQRKRGRKKKAQSPDDESFENKMSRSKSMGSLNKDDESPVRRLRQRSRSRASSRCSVTSTEGSETTPKRLNMRSANAEFAEKQKSFMKGIIKTQESADEGDPDEEESPNNVDQNKTLAVKESLPIPPKKGWSRFCWRCFQIGELVACSNLKCKRSYHLRCLSKQHQPNESDKWLCPECTEVESAEKTCNGKPKFDKDFVSTLLNFVYNRMLQSKNSNLLAAANDDSTAYGYDKFIVYPMNLDILQSNINSKKYKSIEAFHCDAKWLLYNCAIFSEKRRYLANAKSILKVCRQELLEIETCFECYFKANTDIEWFTDVCTSPHLLLWAKLRGFPYWPAKAMSVNATTGQVNVRFFGAHDRAWINVKDCYLYSKEDPNGTNPKKQNDIAECIKEVNSHIDKLSETFNGFKHAPLRTSYDPTKEHLQLKQLLPNIDRYNRTTEIGKIVEGLLSGHKPKLTLKIIRTADNTLATSSLETNGEKSHDNGKDERGLTKFKILNSNKTNCQILPVRSGETNKFTVKRSADSWMIQDSKMKKQKCVNSEESEVEKQKGNLMRSLNLERRDSAKVQHNEEVRIEKDGTPTSEKSDGASGRKSANGKRKRANTLHVDENAQTSDSENPVQMKRRSQRIKSMTNSAENADNSKNTAEKVVKEKTSVSEVSVTNTSPPKTTNMTEPPPLVPFDNIQIKPDPDADESPQQNPTSNVPVGQRNQQGPKPTRPTLMAQRQNEMQQNQQARIKVKNIVNLTKNSQDPLQKGKKNYLAPPDRSNKATNAIGPKNQISSQINGPKRSQIQTQSLPSNNMVCIPATDKNGPLNTTSNSQNTSSSSASTESEPPIHALSGILTPNFATAITDLIVRAPPKLATSPKGTRSAFRGEPNNHFNSDAGPTSRLLTDNAHRFTDFFRNIMTDTLSDLAVNGSLEAKNRLLELEIEQLKQKHAKEMAELKHNSDLILSEFKKSQEKREAQLVEEILRKCELERIRAVDKAIEETKKANWCTFCKRDAMYHCCANTWYCGYQCQQKDWSEHMRYCHNGNKQDKDRTEQTRPQHGPNVSSGSNQQQISHRHMILPQTPIGPQTSTPIQRQQVLLPKQNQIGLISQRNPTGPQIISVRGLVK
uniref:CSON004783 protein n=1 Tax=Culicoides sonorensis TaxID=179676 RepID=A0A336LU35_CULSO